MKKALLLAATLLAAAVSFAGEKAPATMSLADGKVTVLFFIKHDCAAVDAFEPRMLEIANRFSYQGVRFYAIGDATKREYPFPFLEDDGAVAREYGVHVVPFAVVIDAEGKVRYRGFIDDSPKASERQVEGVISVLNALANGRDVGRPETTATGCGL